MATVLAVAPLGVTVSVARLVPPEVGRNVIMTAQLAFAARLLPQVCVFKNWLAFVPPNVMLESVMGKAMLLVTVTVWLALVVLRIWLGKIRLGGDTVKATATPLPESGMFCVDAPTRIENAAVFRPAVVGRNVAVTVQLAPEASDLPQVRASVN
jgi:hypothetical protein